MKKCLISYTAVIVALAAAICFMPIVDTLLVNVDWLTPVSYDAAGSPIKILFTLPCAFLTVFAVLLPIVRWKFKVKQWSFTRTTAIIFTLGLLSTPYLTMQNGVWYYSQVLDTMCGNWVGGGILALIGIGIFASTIMLASVEKKPIQQLT